MLKFKNKILAILLCGFFTSSALIAKEEINMSKNIETIYFAAGCFWGVEKYFDNLDGVVDARSGYMGGNYDNPTYEDVLNYRELSSVSKIVNHTETVEVKYDSSKISAEDLIKSFWELHDPTQYNRQGNDIGNNYRSAIFYTTQEQEKIAFKTKDEYQKLLMAQGYGKIETQILPADKFWVAEDYHQDYLKRNPHGYCPNHSTGVKFQKETAKKNSKITPIGGKEILVIVSDSFCPYCEKLEEETLSSYNGDISLREATYNNIDGFDIKTKLTASPTILFIEDGKEIFSHVGYVTQKEFYRMLGDFKLGVGTQSHNVAFNQGTDNRFCQQYDIFKHTPDGVFVDKLSGDILFDTKDRFDSGSGWLSFYKAVDGATIEKDDFSYGMHRVEVIAKKSGIHLGHVFPHKHNTLRYCINATVLDFIPRDKL